MPTVTVEVRMFGPLELRAGTARLGPRDLGGVKPKQLLELLLLLLERGRTAPNDRIADRLARLILFDKRGTGLSDPARLPHDPRAQRERACCARRRRFRARHPVRHLRGALCVQLAADHPDRVAGLILHNSMARMRACDGYPWGWPSERYDRFVESLDAAWMGDGAGLVRRNPGLAGNPRYREWFSRYVRMAANPWMARRLAEMNGELDVRAALAGVRAPTLVICRTDDASLSAENSHYLAEHIAGAQLRELPGVDHDPWSATSSRCSPRSNRSSLRPA